MKDEIKGQLVVWSTDGETISKNNKMTLRVCHGESPKIVEISDETFNVDERGFGISIHFDLEELKELVSKF
jgi:hypothetical protein